MESVALFLTLGLTQSPVQDSDQTHTISNWWKYDGVRKYNFENQKNSMGLQWVMDFRSVLFVIGANGIWPGRYF